MTIKRVPLREGEVKGNFNDISQAPPRPKPPAPLKQNSTEKESHNEPQQNK